MRLHSPLALSGLAVPAQAATRPKGLAVQRIDTTCHSAYLDAMTGEGLLVMPLPADDLHLDARDASLHASDELAILAKLDAMGWDLSDDEQGQPWAHAGWTVDGREAFGLFGREPITSAPTLLEQAQAHEELRRAAGLAVTT